MDPTDILDGSRILQVSDDEFPSQCVSVNFHNVFHVSSSLLALSAYTLPSQAESMLMSLARLPGQSVLTSGISGHILALGLF
jgi:hypothetical protein